MHARLRRWIILVLLAFAARPTAPAGAPAAPTSQESLRRVVLLSLDGASTNELHRLYAEGAFTTGGFARFFAEGQVAERLVPVNPALTAPNHISLATGYTADRTGIVGNNFHPPDRPFLETVSGFAAPIATETLWEAARRQGKLAAVLGWPGADNTSERRRADWGMAYVNAPDRRAELVTLERRSWQPAPGFAKLAGVESHSPIRGAQVQVGAGGPTQTFNLLAVDGTDNGRVDYDGVVVLQAQGEGRALEKPVPVAADGWQDVACRFSASPEAVPRGTRCPVKLLELTPDLQRVRLYFDGLYSLPAYPSEFAAALAARKLVWPGPPDDDRLSDAWAGKPGIDLATWTEQDERFARFFGDSLLAAVERPGWDLLMGYFPVIDEAGHQLTLADPRQPGFSAARRDELAAARRRVWQAVDRELTRLLAAVDLRTTTVAVVSDHGMVWTGAMP